MHFSSRAAFTLSAILALAPTAGLAEQPAVSTAPAEQEVEALTVYASPGCGCCAKWATYLEKHGVQAEVQRIEDMGAVKDKYDIPPQYRSCHTAVSADGHVFEGHIPLRYIAQFQADPPQNAIGLSVPGMPAGSPGMEMGEHFTPYKVLLLKEGGKAEVFAEVESPAQQ